MGINSDHLSIDGKGKCISCRKNFSISKLETCVICDRFVCKTCATYRKQGSPYGYVCKSCSKSIK